MNKIRNEYNYIHQWLRKNYGSADHCENPECLHKSNKFQYAVIHEKGYEYKRENFIQLCSSCHSKYDRLKEWNPDIKSEEEKNKIKKYRQTEEYKKKATEERKKMKDYFHEYRQTESYKEYVKKYRQTEEYKKKWSEYLKNRRKKLNQ